MRRGREFEAGDLRTCIAKSSICGSVFLFEGCFSRCGNRSKLKRGSQGLLEKPWQVLELVLDIRGLLRYLNWVRYPSIIAECRCNHGQAQNGPVWSTGLVSLWKSCLQWEKSSPKSVSYVKAVKTVMCLVVIGFAHWLKKQMQTRVLYKMICWFSCWWVYTY